MDGLSTPLSFRRRDPLLALVTDAVHRLDRQVFEITVTLRLHPQSGRYADRDPGVGHNRACCCFRIPSHVCSMHHGGRACRQRMHASLADRGIWPHVNDQRTCLRETLRCYSRTLHKKSVLVMVEVPCSRQV